MLHLQSLLGTGVIDFRIGGRAGSEPTDEQSLHLSGLAGENTRGLLRGEHLRRELGSFAEERVRVAHRIAQVVHGSAPVGGLEGEGDWSGSAKDSVPGDLDTASRDEALAVDLGQATTVDAEGPVQVDLALLEGRLLDANEEVDLFGVLGRLNGLDRDLLGEARSVDAVHQVLRVRRAVQGADLVICHRLDLIRRQQSAFA
mmetsp:Transcript_3120/g.5110  ORF Transcript_3120/g.5110 Transcript_3120/m.5110 type:complete len:201 (+) Transcript_3120:546-1148(+)